MEIFAPRTLYRGHRLPACRSIVKTRPPDDLFTASRLRAGANVEQSRPTQRRDRDGFFCRGYSARKRMRDWWMAFSHTISRPPDVFFASSRSGCPAGIVHRRVGSQGWSSVFDVFTNRTAVCRISTMPFQPAQGDLHVLAAVQHRLPSPFPRDLAASGVELTLQPRAVAYIPYNLRFEMLQAGALQRRAACLHACSRGEYVKRIRERSGSHRLSRGVLLNVAIDRSAAACKNHPTDLIGVGSVGRGTLALISMFRAKCGHDLTGGDGSSTCAWAKSQSSNYTKALSALPWVQARLTSSEPASLGRDRKLPRQQQDGLHPDCGGEQQAVQ